MKRYMFFLLTFSVINLETAEATQPKWVPIANAGKEFIAYVDVNNYTKKDNKMFVWVMFDFNIKQVENDQGGFFSGISYKEFDCDSRFVQILSMDNFFDHMGRGSIHSRFNKVGSNLHIIPGSIDDYIYEFVCK